eukprot:TCONS_00030636-protein
MQDKSYAEAVKSPDKASMPLKTMLTTVEKVHQSTADNPSTEAHEKNKKAETCEHAASQPKKSKENVKAKKPATTKKPANKRAQKMKAARAARKKDSQVDLSGPEEPRVIGPSEQATIESFNQLKKQKMQQFNGFLIKKVEMTSKRKLREDLKDSQFFGVPPTRQPLQLAKPPAKSSPPPEPVKTPTPPSLQATPTPTSPSSPEPVKTPTPPSSPEPVKTPTAPSLPEPVKTPTPPSSPEPIKTPTQPSSPEPIKTPTQPSSPAASTQASPPQKQPVITQTPSSSPLTPTKASPTQEPVQTPTPALSPPKPKRPPTNTSSQSSDIHPINNKFKHAATSQFTSITKSLGSPEMNWSLPGVIPMFFSGTSTPGNQEGAKNSEMKELKSWISQEFNKIHATLARIEGKLDRNDLSQIESFVNGVEIKNEWTEEFPPLTNDPQPHQEQNQTDIPRTNHPQPQQPSTPTEKPIHFDIQ